MAIKDVLILADQIGLTDVILPFVLVFTVVYAVLQKTKVLGQDAKGNPKSNYNAMVALVLGFFVLALIQTVQVITWFTRYVAIILVAFVFLGILFSLLGVREHHKNTLMFVALMLLSFVLIQVLAWTGVLDPDLVSTLLLPVLAVVFLVGGAWFMLSKTREHRAEPARGPTERPSTRTPASQGRRVRAGEMEPGEEPQAQITEEDLAEALQEVLKKKRRAAA